MITLTLTTDKLQIVLAGAVTANHLQCFASWRDNGNSNLEGRTVSNTNNTTDVDLVAAPGENVRRDINNISIFNADTVNAVVTVKIDANGTEYILHKCTLSTGDRLEYSDKEGWHTNCPLGCIKHSFYYNSGIPVVNVLNTVVLAGDVANANATANTIADVTGLSFAVTAGQTYWFKFSIDYTSAATTTGSRWSINGPAVTRLAYSSIYSLTTTTNTSNTGAAAYDIPAASNATSPYTTGNIAVIEGFVTPSGNGTIIARFASEITVSAITAKAGSICQWMRVL
jgi:hypothetical protein